MKNGTDHLRGLVSPQVSQDDIAKALDVSQQAVSAWVNGRAKPSYKRQLKLQELYGVPVESWEFVNQEAS